MLTERLIHTALLSCVLACPASAQDSLLLRDYRFVKQQDAWLTSPNAAALTRFASQRIAEAELSAGMGRGGLTDFYESPKSLCATASVESFYRINRRTVVFGSISYENYTGRDMTGSAFMHLPTLTHYPFDLVEDSLTNAGRKHRDTYRLTGAVGTDLYKGLSLGLRLDYTAANYAKYKDLRHKNKLMDMTLTAGLYLPAGAAQFGLDYSYRRTTESVSFNLYGREEKVYKTLIDYAAMTGRIEQFGNSGYTDKSREMPLVDDYNGLSLQAAVQPAGQLDFYNSFTYFYREGYYGRKSPYTITYTGHHSHGYQYDARLTWTPRKARISIDASVAVENLENTANIYRELINDNGANYYEYYTPVKTANKVWVDTRVRLTADMGILHELPTWTVAVGYDQSRRKQTAYFYPYYRRQHLTTHDYTVSATRRLPCRQGVWSFSLDAAFRHGTGAPCEDYTFVEPNDRQEVPALMEAFLYREYQYLTAAQYSVGGSVQYAFLFPGTRLKTHARLGLSHRKGNETYDYSQGCDHTQATLTLGCTF